MLVQGACLWLWTSKCSAPQRAAPVEPSPSLSEQVSEGKATPEAAEEPESEAESEAEAEGSESTEGEAEERPEEAAACLGREMDVRQP